MNFGLVADPRVRKRDNGSTQQDSLPGTLVMCRHLDVIGPTHYNVDCDEQKIVEDLFPEYG